MADDPKEAVPPTHDTAPTPGIDETVPGGAYRFEQLDKSVIWRNAEGDAIDAPKGKK